MKKRLIFVVMMFIVFGLLYFMNRPKNEGSTYVRIEGIVFGTSYHITMKLEDEKIDSSKAEQFSQYLKAQIESRLQEFDNSLSTFNPNSVISRINSNVGDTLWVDDYFTKMYIAADQVWTVTNGAFDITCAPLVNACGFGYNPDRNVSQAERDSIKEHYVGFRKIHLCEQGERKWIRKDNPNVRLDASAIAKGQGVDVVAELLDSLGKSDYMVEIGGEVRVKGVNNKGEDWLIGISKPVDDTLSATYTELQCAVRLHDQSLATSGNYLQFYYKDGKRFSHTVDPRTAAPVNHSLLSASIIAKDCMMADALATSCMVVGLDSAMTMIGSMPEVEGYFIWADENGNYNTSHTEGFIEINIEN